MKLIYTLLPLLHLTNSAAIQPAVLSTRDLSFSLADSVLQSAANAAFSESEVVFPAGTVVERQEVVTPDYLYTVMCVDAGFRGDCVVFGAAPGKCVNFFDFDTNVTLSATYDNAVSSLSTNTGGVCQFYKNATCNSLGDDPGVTASYLYNLGVATSEYSADYDDQITSWRC